MTLSGLVCTLQFMTGSNVDLEYDLYFCAAVLCSVLCLGFNNNKNNNNINNNDNTFYL